MRGSAAFRAAVAPGGVLAGPWVKNELWRRAKAVPSLDLRFAENKSLTDATTGQNLVTFTRASSGTYVGSDGVLRTAVTNLLLQSEDFSTSWFLTGATLSTNAIAAPNGTLTAEQLIETATTANHEAGQTFASPVANATYTLSCYLKAATSTTCGIRFSVGLNGTGVICSVDLAAQTATVTAGTGTATIANAGSGWFRVSLTATASGSPSSTTVNIFRALGTAGSTSNSIYLWGAQLEQSATAGEYIPTTSTINSAPRFDHNPTTGESLGLLVEEARSNLCLQSEAFGTSPWSASNVTVTANTETSPAVTLTADTLAATGANGTVQQPVTTTAIAMTFSVYLKRKTGTGNIDITADGTTWVTQTINSSAWTRCIVTQTAVAGTSNPGIRIVASGDEVYAWGGQYE